MRKKLNMPEDQVKVACDATSIRSFVSYLVHRHDGSKRSESCLPGFLLSSFSAVCVEVSGT